MKRTIRHKTQRISNLLINLSKWDPFEAKLENVFSLKTTMQSYQLIVILIKEWPALTFRLGLLAYLEKKKKWPILFSLLPLGRGGQGNRSRMCIYLKTTTLAVYKYFFRRLTAADWIEVSFRDEMVHIVTFSCPYVNSIKLVNRNHWMGLEVIDNHRLILVHWD